MYSDEGPSKNKFFKIFHLISNGFHYLKFFVFKKTYTSLLPFLIFFLPNFIMNCSQVFSNEVQVDLFSLGFI